MVIDDKYFFLFFVFKEVDRFLPVVDAYYILPRIMMQGRWNQGAGWVFAPLPPILAVSDVKPDPLKALV